MSQSNITPLLVKAQKSKNALVAVSDAKIKKVLVDLSRLLIDSMPVLLKANAADIIKQGMGNPQSDRLLLNETRIKNIAAGIRKIAGLPNPANKVLERRTLPNKLHLEKISTPLGIVGAIYESRPNVTFDIAALCLRSRNACVLKGSSEAENSNHAAVMLIRRALRNNGLPPDLVTLVPSDRSIVNQMMIASEYLDVLIPRGSASLIDYVRRYSEVPIIETGAGVCHTYIHAAADLDMAVNIVINAKVSRPSVCNSLDTILIDRAVSEVFLQKIRPELEKHQVGLFADRNAFALLKGYPLLTLAKKEDFDREFLSLNAAVRIVKDMDQALEHIATHSTKHSEAIVSKDKKACERFLTEVDAAAVYSNASTRFTDGEEFGLGAEIGISTQKLHARGPFALEKLVTEKWILRGDGQIRE